MKHFDHIFFGNSDLFSSFWNANQAFPKSLSRFGRVLYIPYNFTLPRTLRYDHDLNMLKKIFKGIKIINIQENLFIYYPLPGIHFGIKDGRLFSLKDKVIAVSMNNFFSKIQTRFRSLISRNTIIWSTSIHTHLIKKIFPDNLVIYYVYDDWRYYKHTNIEFVEKNEKKISKLCDYVLTVSQVLTKRFKTYKARVIQSHIGVNIDFTTYNFKPQIDTNITNLGSNIIGFLGRLDNYVDFELIKLILKKFPLSKIVIVGPIKHNLEFVKYNNLHKIINLGLLPSVGIEDVPNVVYSFDICILPFKKNEITEAGDPMKMYDYVISGKPIVAIKVNKDMEKFTKFAYLCENQNDFIEAISRILKGRSKHVQYKQRIDFLKKYNWDNTVLEVLENIKDKE